MDSVEESKCDRCTQELSNLISSRVQKMIKRQKRRLRMEMS